MTISRLSTGRSEQQAIGDYQGIVKHFHVSYVILISIHNYSLVQHLTDFDLTIVEKSQGLMILASGSIQQWINAIKTCDRFDHKIQWIFNQVQSHLEKNGFQSLFTGFIKTPIKDGLFYLTEKK